MQVRNVCRSKMAGNISLYATQKKILILKTNTRNMTKKYIHTQTEAVSGLVFLLGVTKEKGDWVIAVGFFMWLLKIEIMRPIKKAKTMERSQEYGC